MKKTNRRRSAMSGFLAALLFCSLMIGAAPVRVSAASSSEIKNQLNELKDQKKEIQAELDEVRSKVKANSDDIEDIVANKDAIDQELALLNQRVDNINQQLSAYALLIADKQDELDEAKVHLDELNEKNKERIRSMEEEGDLSYWSIIFKANDFSDLLDRLNMINEIAAADRRRLEELSTAAALVEQAQLDLQTEKQGLEDAMTELDNTMAEMEIKRIEADELLTKLISKGKEFEALMDDAMAEQDELLEEIAKKEKEYKDAKYKEWLATYVPPTTRPSSGSTTPSSGAPSSSGWLQPLSSYRISSPFGMRVHPITGKTKMHKGVDMAAPQGTPIYASKSGRVSTASYQANGAGYYVSINHGGGFSSIYMHMTHFIVSAGQHVDAGQVIGYVGSTGRSTGPHLHFGIAYNGEYVNPMQYL